MQTFGAKEYAEIGSRFKAAHVKTFCWWVAVKVSELAKSTDA